MSTATRFLLGLLLLAGAACTVKETSAPPLTGPSELALRIALTAIPDSILQDGASQTAIQIEATGADGRPVRGLALRLEVIFRGEVQDFGTLSAKTVVTGDDGRARVTYTAPPRSSEPVEQFNVVTIHVTPIGADFRGEIPRTIDLRLVTPGVLLPPNAGPVARFTFTPATVELLSNVIFDASTSTDEGVPCGSACSYAWDFGDGSTGTGIFVTHQFRTAGTFLVRLTVTDGRGAASSLAQTITIGRGTPPTVPPFTISPAAPRVGQTIFFSAEASRAATGRRIVSYEWDFGSGRTGSGVMVQKVYDVAGTYVVTLTVTDDAGERTTVSRDVVVNAGTGPQAALTVSPASGTTATDFFFDARGSRPVGFPIATYRFTFGDGSPDQIGAAPTATYRYNQPGNYVASVIVTDSNGGSGFATVNVTVR